MKIFNFKLKSSSLEKLFFYLAILFLPTQLGKHFWPNFSSIQGVRVDYLSSTIYLTDIFIFLLFVLTCFSILKRLNFKFQIKDFKIKKLLEIGNYLILAVLVLFMLAGVVFSKSPYAGFYGLLKFCEFLFFGLYAALSVKRVKDLKEILYLLIPLFFVESLLSIAQFLNNGSVGGIFYLLGERSFNAQTPGIANASLQGSLILRPYGTLPHPNVLSGYLLISMIFFIFLLSKTASLKIKIFIFSCIALGSFSLFITLSRIAILIYLLITVLIFFKLLYSKNKIQKKVIYFLVLFSVFALIFFTPFPLRLLSSSLSDESVTQREYLIEKSIAFAKSSPFFGVGLNNYLVNTSDFKSNRVFLVQPVHNIYLLVLTETGLFGLIFFIYFILKTFKKLIFNKLRIYKYLFLALLSICFLGFFDHYFLTLQQGQLIFSLVLGLSWTSIKEETKIV